MDFSCLQFGGVKEGDFIVAIGENDVKWSSHDEVVYLIKRTGDNLTLKLVTPMDRNYLKPKSKSSSCSVNSMQSSSSGVSSEHSPIGSIGHAQKRLTWNPFKRQSIVANRCSENENVILR